MAVITVRIDDSLKKKMESMKDVNWSEIARRAIESKIAQTELWQNVDIRLMREASNDIDKLQRRIPGWDSTEEVRKWRQRDHQPR